MQKLSRTFRLAYTLEWPTNYEIKLVSNLSIGTPVGYTINHDTEEILLFTMDFVDSNGG